MRLNRFWILSFEKSFQRTISAGCSSITSCVKSSGPLLWLSVSVGCLLLLPSVTEAVTKIAPDLYVAGKTIFDLWAKKQEDAKLKQMSEDIAVIKEAFKHSEKKQNELKDHIDRDVERYVLRYMKDHKV